MNQESSRLVQEAATKFLELAKHGNIEWDSIHLMFDREEGCYGGTEVYKLGRQVRFFGFDFDDAVAEEITDSIHDTLNTLFDALKEQTGKSPSACVVSVDRDLDFKVKFAHGTKEGMSVRLKDLGKPESFFEESEVDIPDFIKEAQAKGL